MAKKLKFQKIGEQVIDLMRPLRKECVKFLKRKLKDNGKIDLTEMEEDCGTVCVTYDGGRHPEYDTNAYSTVWSVFKKDNEIYLETEDCDEYSIDRIDTMELYGVCDFIAESKEYFNPDKD